MHGRMEMKTLTLMMNSGGSHQFVSRVKINQLTIEDDVLGRRWENVVGEEDWMAKFPSNDDDKTEFAVTAEPDEDKGDMTWLKSEVV